MQVIDINNIDLFCSTIGGLYRLLYNKYKFFKYITLNASVFSSGNYMIVVHSRNQEKTFSVYCSPNTYIVKDGIDDNINVVFTLDHSFITNIMKNKDDYELNPHKLLKFIPKFFKSIRIDSENFYKDSIIGKMVSLRPGVENDIYYMLKWYNDVELNKLAGWTNTKVTASKLRYNMSRSFGYDPMNLIIDNENGKPIGTIQLYSIDEQNKNCNLGIRIGDKDHWGKGYGEDSINTILEYAFFNMDMYRVNLKVYEYNVRAYKCYLKCGFKDEGKTRKSAFIDGMYYDEIVMGILKDDYINLMQKKE